MATDPAAQYQQWVRGCMGATGGWARTHGFDFESLKERQLQPVQCEVHEVPGDEQEDVKAQHAVHKDVVLGAKRVEQGGPPCLGKLGKTWVAHDTRDTVAQRMVHYMNGVPTINVTAIARASSK